MTDAEMWKEFKRRVGKAEEEMRKSKKIWRLESPILFKMIKACIPDIPDISEESGGGGE